MQTLVDKDEAAQLLGRACRTVELYANKGLLSRVRRGRRVYFQREEVESLRTSLDTGNARETPTLTAIEMQKRIDKLEREVALLMRILGSRRRVPLMDAELALLLERATIAMTSNRYMVATCESWALTLTNLREEDFVRAGRDSWVTFHRLCLRLIDYLITHKSFKRSLEMQKAHALLLNARQSMRNEILMLLPQVDMEHYEQMFGEPLDPKREVFALL